MSYEEIELTRDCEAIQVPQGAVVVIPKGTQCSITQALGDTYTVQVPRMGLFRIGGNDADALGKEKHEAAAQARAATSGEGATENDIWDTLKDVYDPEIPVNIVDLGLIYDLRINPLASGGKKVSIQMTLTAPGCGMGQAIAMDAKRRIEMLSGVQEAEVQLVWDPPWSPQMISAAGKEKLGIG